MNDEFWRTEVEVGEVIGDDDFLFYDAPEGSGWTRLSWLNRVGTKVREGERVIRLVKKKDGE